MTKKERDRWDKYRDSHYVNGRPKNCTSCKHSDMYGSPTFTTDHCMTCGSPASNWEESAMIKRPAPVSVTGPGGNYPGKVSIGTIPGMTGPTGSISPKPSEHYISLDIEKISNGWILTINDEKHCYHEKENLLRYIDGII